VDVDLMEKILDPAYLGNAAALFSLVQQVLDKHGRSVSAWVGESGGAYNSGHDLVTNAFVMGFWYDPCIYIHFMCIGDSDLSEFPGI
jgi:heparanase 1